MRLDTTRLGHDVAHLASTCTDLKKLLRTTWTRPMAEEQRAHARARRRATELLVLLAHARGRIHAQTLSPDEHARVAERVATPYLLNEEVPSCS